jgi:type VI secretion system protein VasD
MRMPACLILFAHLSISGCGLTNRLPSAPPAPREVAIKLHAADRLNSDARGHSLALVTRIYKLRQHAAFERAPFDTFLSPQKEREVFGADLIDVREVQLVPGQRFETIEKVSPEAGYIGVVALFHSPSARRWRLSFSIAEAERNGISIGAQACNLSVANSPDALLNKAGARPSVPCQ